MRSLPLLAALVALLVSSSVQGESFDEKTNSPQHIREILLRNPEIIRDVIIELNKRDADAKRQQTAKIIQDEKEAIYKLHSGLVIGNQDPDITIVELFDYNCSFCKSAFNTMLEISRNYDVKILVKDYPVLGPDSIEASKIALAAYKLMPQHEFEKLHSRLLSLKGNIGKEAVLSLAVEAGLSKDALEQLAPTFQADFNETVRIAEKLGVKGTPTFLIGDTLYSGLGDLEALKASIQAMQQCGKVTC